jgi:hypothetical protein
VGEASMCGCSPWGQGSYGTTFGNPFAVGTRLLRIHTFFALGTPTLRREDTAPTEMRVPPPRRSPLRGRSSDVRMFARMAGLLRNHTRATPSPWGHGSYEPTPSSPWGQGSYAFTYLLRRGDTAPTEMRVPHPRRSPLRGRSSDGEWFALGTGLLRNHTRQPLRRGDTAPTGERAAMGTGSAESPGGLWYSPMVFGHAALDDRYGE